MNDMKTLIRVQRLEKTCEEIYHYLSLKIKNEINANVLAKISADESEHYEQIKK